MNSFKTFAAVEGERLSAPESISVWNEATVKVLSLPLPTSTREEEDFGHLLTMAIEGRLSLRLRRCQERHERSAELLSHAQREMAAIKTVSRPVAAVRGRARGAIPRQSVP